MYKYISNPYSPGELPSKGGQGWLRVRLEMTGEIVELPMYLSVQMLPKSSKQQPGREYFRIVEGAYLGREASVSLRTTEQCKNSFLGFQYNCTTSKDSYLLDSVTRLPPCTVRYRKSQASYKNPEGGTFKYPSEYGTLEVGTGLGNQFAAHFSDLEYIHQFDVLNPGVYKLRIPGWQHVDKGTKYLSDTVFATTWYRIEEELYLENLDTAEIEKGKMARFFHIGQGSEGCITIRSNENRNSRLKWGDIVQYINKCRLGFQHVGYLEVLPEVSE